MTFGSSILLFDHITLNAGSTDTHTFNPTKIVQLSEYFRIVFVADAYNNAIGASPDYTPLIKLRVVAKCASGDAYEYVLYPVDIDGMGFRQDIRLRSGEYNLLTFSIINGTNEPLAVSKVMFCPESREEDITKIMNSVVNLDKAYYGVTVSEEYGLQIDRDDGASSTILNSDTFAMRAMVDGQLQDRLYFDVQKGDFVFNGVLGADAIFTDSMYAETGIISELTVDRLSTSKRVRAYILGDTSDDNYIRIEEQYIQFVTGTVSATSVLATESGVQICTEDDVPILLESRTAEEPATIQAENRYGEKLYWQKEPISHTADGYPLDANGVQIYAAADVTDWPVYTYLYTELVKLQITFVLENGVYTPKIILGAGDHAGNSIGYLYKTRNGLQQEYVDSYGNMRSIRMTDAGYVDIDKMRRPTRYDFSKIGEGSFEETIDGEITTTYGVERDSAGRIVKITDEDGHETEVVWQ